MARSVHPPDDEDDLGGLSLGHRAEVGRVEAALFGGEPEVVEVGPYAVERVVGRGAFGTVYAAQDARLARTAAVKVLAASDEDAQDRLLREARLMATVAHPNIATVYEVGTFEHGGRTKVFVAMEYVVGQTLRALLGTGRRDDMLRLLVQAGRGLAAAHQAGVIHRDFKPDNVLVGEDGRVRVVDFGLASTDRTVATLPDDVALDVATATRGLAGTPAYMAPELFAGEPSSVHSDQFAYCVTALEALCGTRPFAADGLATLIDNVEAGRVRQAVQQSAIPARVKGALLQGLAVDPKDRHASVEVLVEALESYAQRSGTRRRVALIGAGAAVAGVAAGAAWRGDRLRPKPACAVDLGRVEVLLTSQRRTAAQAAFLEASPRLGPPTWTRVEGRIDAFVQRWRDTGEAVCERPAQTSDARRIRGMEAECLALAAQSLDQLLAAFERADVDLVAAAVRSVRTLPQPRRCLDDAALLAAQPDPEDAPRVAEIRAQLSSARLAVTAGRYPAAREVFTQAVADAEAVGFEPLVVEAKTRLAQLDLKTGRYPSSRALAKDAFDRAVTAADPRGAIAATVLLAQAGVADPNHLEAGLSWVDTGTSMLASIEDAPRLRSTLAMARASLLITSADGEQATAALEAAVAALSDEDPDHPDLAVALGNWGTLLLRQGRPADATQRYAEALERVERSLGPEHPDVAQWLLGLGSASMTLGELDEADRHLERSLELHLRTVGPEHPNTIQTRMYLGVLAHNRRAWDVGIEQFDAALVAAETSLGKTHPLVAEVCLRFADTLSLAEDHARAKSIAERARAIQEEMLPAGDARLGPVYAVGMVVASRAGRTDDAIALGEEGLKVTTTAAGDRDPLRVNLLHELGRIQLDAGRVQRAIDLLDRAAAALDEGVQDPRRAALVQFDLARAHWPTNPDAAREHATRAHQRLPADAPAPERAEIEAWLGAHRADTVGTR